MDHLYSIPNSSEHKLGLGLLGSELDNLQFPTSCAEIDHEQLLALDDPQSFYLAFPDAGVFGTYDESISRTSTAVTPQSECSSRTNISGRNISPTSDIMSFHDQPNPHDLESIIHDTTQSIISGRHSRAASLTWTQPINESTGLNSTLTSSRQFSHRPQSFTYRTPQIQQPDGTTPPAPSSYFTSPNIQQNQAPSATRSPYLSPNMQSPLTPGQNIYIQTTNLSPNPSSYFALPQSQPPPHYPHGHSPNAFQLGRQQQQQQQHQALRQPHQNNLSVNASPNASMINSFYTQQSGPNPPTNSNANLVNINSNTTALPHTTGNSSTGYQCFSHGCGGRHFSNWGNLVRHHRERQLRSKTGAKPTCPRCGKGFTRSSARDAHVAGLKCVLGRRRRGQSAASAATADADAQKSKPANKDGSEEQDQEELEPDSPAQKTRENSEDAETAEDDDEDGDGGNVAGDDMLDGFVGAGSLNVGRREDLDLDLDGPTPAFLNPQQLEFS